MKSSQILKLKMSPEEVEQFQGFLMRESGLVFEGRRTQEMEHAVATRMIELGISSFEEYHRFISDRKQAPEELSQLVISLTVGETQFFRTPDQFAALRKYILPELIKERRGRDKRLTIVSAGCATGEEPYSMNILLNELIPDLKSWTVKIAGLDINREFLKQAREGVYNERKVRLVDPATRGAYLDRLSKNQWRVQDHLRRNIEWKLFNVTSDDIHQVVNSTEIDLILCRNVLIYFNAQTIRRVIQSFHRVLSPGGYLMLGYSESLFRINDSFQTIHTPEAFLYQKTEEGAVPGESQMPLGGPLEREDFIKVLGSRPHPWVEQPKSPPEESLPPGMIEHLLSHTEPEAAPPPPSIALVPPAKDLPEASEGEMWEEGLRLFAEERFEQAGEKFERMLSAHPHSPRAHLGLALLYANRGAEERSREYVEKARSHDDLLPEIYFLLALLDERGGEMNRAIQNYQRVILLDNDFAMAHFNLGNVYLKLGRDRDANREFGNTIAILERDLENHSLRFSGGLSREAVISFCRMQRESGSSPRRARAN